MLQLFGQGLVGGQRRFAGQGLAQHAERRGAGQLAVVADEELVEVVFLDAHDAGGGFVEALAEHQQYRAQPVFLLRRRAEGVQAERLGRLRQLVQVVVQFVDEGAEILVDAGIVPAHVLVDVFLLDPFFQVGRQLVLHRAIVLRQPLVQQVVDEGQRFVQPGRREGRRLVGDDDRPAAPLGLQRFADVVDDVGIDHRHIADGEQRVIGDGQAALLAGQPFLRAVRAVVHQRIGLEVLAQPQVVGQVEMRRRRLGRVVEGFFLLLPAFATWCLRAEDDLADGQARHDEDRFAAVDGDHRRFFRVAPAFAQFVLDGCRLALQPGLVGGDRQALGQAVAQQAGQFAIAIEGGEQALQQFDQAFFGFAMGVVAGVAQGLERGFETARQVHERGRHVLFARRVVPEQHRHLLVGIRQALQANQLQRLVHDGSGLLGQGDDLAGLLVRGAGDDGIDDAGVFALGQVEGHVDQRHALRVGPPGGFVALAVGQRLDDRDAEFGQFLAPAFGVEHDLRADHRIGDRLAVDRQHFLVRPHYPGVVGQRDGAAGFDAGDQVIDEGGLLGADVDLVEGDGDGRRPLVEGDAAPFEILGRRGENAVRRLGVVDRIVGEDEGRGQPGLRLAAQLGGQGGEEAFVVGAPAVGVIGVQPGSQLFGQAIAGGAVVLHPQVRRLQAIQRLAQLAFDGILHVAAGGIENDEIGFFQ